MSFIVSTDSNGLIKAEVLSNITQGDTSVQAWAEIAAQAQIEALINQRYDVGVLFGKTGTDRDPLLLMYMIDMVLYHIHSRIPEREMAKKREDRYEIALQFFRKVNIGEITPAWPRVDQAVYNEDNQFIMHSNLKLTQQW